MTRRGSCVKLNDDYTLARVSPISLPATFSSSTASFSFTPFSPSAALPASCAFPHQRLNRTILLRAAGKICFTQSVAIIEYLFCPPPLALTITLVLSRACLRDVSAGTCLGKIPGASLPTDQVITCRDGRDKNPPIAINHVELEKTRIYVRTHLSSSLFLARARTQHVLFLLLGRDRSRGDFPLIAVKRDTLRPGQNIGISFETRYGHSCRAITVYSDRKHRPRCEREKRRNLLYSSVIFSDAENDIM